MVPLDGYAYIYYLYPYTAVLIFLGLEHSMEFTVKLVQVWWLLGIQTRGLDD